ncbi:MAG: hypothetical protein D6B26_06205 [Spirochaetaceae bacterium]|nr:MAG: hypothetical protein D6B26_06205 [Spirochaetaceae bacterium]
MILGADLASDGVAVRVVWLDGDSLPVKVRELVFRRALKLGLDVRVVANRLLPVPATAEVQLVLVPPGDDEADAYILANAGERDLVITRDIPLACALAERGLRVINDRGVWYDLETARERLSVRDFAFDLRQSGIDPGRRDRFGSRELHAFAGTFEQALRRGWE